MQTASRKLFSLPLPSDSRLAPIFSFNTVPPPLNVVTRHVGASEKTIGRIFQRETGLSYQQWRQQWRFSCAIERLAKKESISHIARHLDFDSDSAFIAFFRKMSGTTPRAYSIHFSEADSD
jgi:AraC-like DNA-binding protein